MLDQFLKHRLKLKENNKPGALTFKIVLNGIFGRTNSIYSALYEPSLHGSVCGQLIILEVFTEMVPDDLLWCNTD